MVKNIINSLSRGIFYTIGKFIAIGLLFLLIGYLLKNIDLSQLKDINFYTLLR